MDFNTIQQFCGHKAITRLPIVIEFLGITRLLIVIEFLGITRLLIVIEFLGITTLTRLAIQRNFF